MEAVHFIVAVERADEQDKTNGGFRVEMDYSTCFPTFTQLANHDHWIEIKHLTITWVKLGLKYELKL